MPLYEYRCEVCGAAEEKLQSFSAPTEHVCASCGATEGMKRQISRTAFALSGSGWYASGYGEGAPSKTSDDKGSTTSSEAKSETSSPAACKTGCACHSPAVTKAVEAPEKA